MGDMHEEEAVREGGWKVEGCCVLSHSVRAWWRCGEVRGAWFDEGIELGEWVCVSHDEFIVCGIEDYLARVDVDMDCEEIKPTILDTEHIDTPVLDSTRLYLRLLYFRSSSETGKHSAKLERLYCVA